MPLDERRFSAYCLYNNGKLLAVLGVGVFLPVLARWERMHDFWGTLNLFDLLQRLPLSYFCNRLLRPVFWRLPDGNPSRLLIIDYCCSSCCCCFCFCFCICCCPSPFVSLLWHDAPTISYMRSIGWESRWYGEGSREGSKAEELSWPALRGGLVHQTRPAQTHSFLLRGCPGPPRSRCLPHPAW